jgi:hypothetical protein
MRRILRRAKDEEVCIKVPSRQKSSFAKTAHGIVRHVATKFMRTLAHKLHPHFLKWRAEKKKFLFDFVPLFGFGFYFRLFTRDFIGGTLLISSLVLVWLACRLGLLFLRVHSERA